MSTDNNAHPLADQIRTRSDLMKRHAELPELLIQIRAEIEAEAAYLRSPEAKDLHKLTRRGVNSASLLLGLPQVFDEGPPENSSGHVTGSPSNIMHTHCMRGEYAAATELFKQPSEDQCEHESTVPLYAVANGDLDDADAMLRESVSFQIEHQKLPRPNRTLQANAELAVLAHIMGREDLVLPALYRGRFVIEGGSACSTRPLLEQPDWVDAGQSSSLYLVHAIAASGDGETALALAGERDLDEWGADMIENFVVMRYRHSFALALGYGGQLEEGVARSGYETDLWWYEMLKQFTVLAFAQGNQALGDRLAGEYLEMAAHNRVCSSEVCEFAEQVQAQGQTDWAQRAARGVLERLVLNDGSGGTILAQLIALLPTAERRVFVDRLKQGSDTEHQDDAPPSEERFQLPLLLLGEIDVHTVEGIWAIRGYAMGLESMNRSEDAQRLVRESLAKVEMHALNFNERNELYPLCAKYQEIERAIELIQDDLPGRMVEAFRLLFMHCGHRPEPDLAAVFARIQRLPDRDHRLSALASLLSGGALRLCFGRNGIERHKYPNVRVLCKAGLYPYLIEGIFVGGC